MEQELQVASWTSFDKELLSHLELQLYISLTNYAFKTESEEGNVKKEHAGGIQTVHLLNV